MSSQDRPVQHLRNRRLRKTFFVAIAKGESYGTAVKVLEDAIAALKKGKEIYHA